MREGLDTLGLRPRGHTLIKPNVVASGPLFPHAHTRAEFVEAMVLALRDRDGGMTELAVGERCGITVPTRAAFDGAGYYAMFERAAVKHYHFEESSQVEIPLRHPQRLRDYVFTPEPVARADFFVNCPKFKSHPWTTVTFAMKNYIGLQDDRHRLIDHDHRLDEKVADLQFITQPQFMAIDAITAGENRMLTPIPFPLRLVIMGDNSVAFDSVCCHIIGVDPASVAHIRLAHEYGFGPLDLNDIDIEGDVTLAEAQSRAAGFKVGRIRVEDYFVDSAITAHAGPPPDPERTDYCWGGCPGALEEAIEIIRLFDAETDAKLPRLHIVFGAHEGDIAAGPDDRVLFIGDCATWTGELAGRGLIRIDSQYRARETKDPHHAVHDDIFKKMASVARTLAKSRHDQVIRLSGCPVSVAELVLVLSGLAGTKNPFFAPSETVRFNRSYLMWKSATMARRLRGQPYQTPGAYAARGRAAPTVTTPRGASSPLLGARREEGARERTTSRRRRPEKRPKDP